MKLIKPTSMKVGLTVSMLMTCIFSFAQQGYNLQFKIEGLRDTTALLGYYYGESTYSKDTARLNATGGFTFTGKEPLKQGVYFIAINKTRVFDFVVGEKQQFKLETSSPDYAKKMKVTGDLDNQLFFDNVRFEMERHKEAEPHIAVIQDSTLVDAEKTMAREEFTKIRQEVLDHHDEIIAKHPETVTARMLNVTKALTLPEPPKKADGSIDSTFQLRWYRKHFFDNMSLSDEAMLLMPKPFYSEKVNEYLDKLFVPNADTVIRAIDNMVAQAKSNKETYKYIIYTFLFKYQNPDIMGLDAVFVHLYDKYFASGEMDYWANDKMKKNLKDHADRLRKSLIGAKGANLIMQDANEKARALYDIPNKYTIVYFFDPDCGACKKETPKLAEFYARNKAKFNVEVYAVSADTSLQKMKDYIKEMNLNWITVNGPRTYVGQYQNLYDSETTPTLYVLDEKKKIIAKKIPAEKLEEFLSNYEQYRKKNGQL